MVLGHTLHVETPTPLLPQLAHPLLVAAGRSSVIMMSSVAGGTPVMRSGAPYGMSKGVERSNVLK